MSAREKERQEIQTRVNRIERQIGRIILVLEYLRDGKIDEAKTTLDVIKSAEEKR